VPRSFLALGSNRGDRREHLRRALARIPDQVAVSSVYETGPIGGPDAQGPYLNMVVELDTELDARRLLELCAELETEAGRIRLERWGPRTLDVDVLWIDGVLVDEPDLQVPHPRMLERRFVQVPLLEVAPDLDDLPWVVDPDDRVDLVDPL
jgi:2-amino-4-hydroxy-6-hydroxymethyldihydropteridine diphosphokinase